MINGWLGLCANSLGSERATPILSLFLLVEEYLKSWGYRMSITCRSLTRDYRAKTESHVVCTATIKSNYIKCEVYKAAGLSNPHLFSSMPCCDVKEAAGIVMDFQENVCPFFDRGEVVCVVLESSIPNVSTSFSDTYENVWFSVEDHFKALR